MQNDLTTGSVFRNVLSFSLPYLLSYFLQTPYGMADLFIIGQFEDVYKRQAQEIFDEAENRLHAQKAVMALLMG